MTNWVRRSREGGPPAVAGAETAEAEIIHRGRWANLAAVELATLTWVSWFNHRCLLESIGNIPPAEAEAHYYAQLSKSRISA